MAKHSDKEKDMKKQEEILEEETCEVKEEEAGEEKEETPEDPKDALLKEKDAKIAELDDKFKRLFAEFDNFRKRSDAEKSTRYSDGERTVLEKVLPLIDNFERALANRPEELKDSAYADGIEKIYRSFMDGLSSMGVTPIEAVGQTFNADLHNAVMHVEDEEAGESEIVEEFQKGYMFNEKVLRYSMVKVAN